VPGCGLQCPALEGAVVLKHKAGPCSGGLCRVDPSANVSSVRPRCNMKGCLHYRQLIRGFRQGLGFAEGACKGSSWRFGPLRTLGCYNVTDTEERSVGQQ
jgi:hypothetical protein